jgi:replicative DNA helicase
VTPADSETLHPRRQLPFDLEAERSVLGSVLLKPSALDQVRPILEPNDFFVPAHGDVWNGFISLRDRKDPIDVVALADELRKAGTLPRLQGSETYLVELAQAVPTAENVLYYAEIVREKAALRRIVSHAGELAALAYGGSIEPQELLARSVDVQNRLASGERLTYFLAERFRSVEQLALLDRKAQPRQYLLTQADRGLLPAGRVAMLAAEGGAGKSWAVVQLAVAVASGDQWLDTFSLNPKRRGQVLLLLGEEEIDEVHYRLEQACDGRSSQFRADVSSNVFPLALAGEDVELTRCHDDLSGEDRRTETRFFRELMRLIEDNGTWSLIVFDPLSRFAASDTETDNAAAARMIRTFERFTHVAGRPTVLFAHHTTKTSRKQGAREATAARGASALTDNARWQANLEPRARFDGAPRLVEFRVVKSNYGWPSDAVTLYSDPDRSGMLRLASPEQLAAWNAARAKGGRDDPSTAVGKPRHAAAHSTDPDENDDYHGWLR